MNTLILSLWSWINNALLPKLEKKIKNIKFKALGEAKPYVTCFCVTVKNSFLRNIFYRWKIDSDEMHVYIFHGNVK